MRKTTSKSLTWKDAWIAGSLMVVAGCHQAGSSTGGGVAITPPATSAPRYFLVSNAAGPSRFGSLSMGVEGLASAETVKQFNGNPWFVAGNNQDYGMVFNPRDNRFYGIFEEGGFRGAGMLVAYDPTTQKLETLLEFPGTGIYGGPPPRGYHTVPLLSPDGKSMFAVALIGGRESRVDQFAGDGALVHINLDPASPKYLAFTPVFEFYSQNLRRVVPQPVWGKDGSGKDAIFLMDEGEEWGSTLPYQKVNGRPFALRPTQAGDLSAPWEYVGLGPDIGDFGTGKMGPFTLFDAPRNRFLWSMRTSSELQVGATGDWFGPNINQVTFGCFANLGLIDNPYSNKYLLFTQGLEKSMAGTLPVPPTPKLVELDKTSTQEFIIRREFNGWFSTGVMPLAMTTSRATGNAFLNVGPLDGSRRLFELGIPGWPDVMPPSSLERLDLATYANYPLLAGNDRLGYYFVGPPAPGGSIHEPINDRYLVQLARWGGDYKTGTLIAYDRLKDVATTVSLGLEGEAYPFGKPIQLDNGKVVGALKSQATGKTPGTIGTSDSQGTYTFDLATRQLTSHPMVSTRWKPGSSWLDVYPAPALEFTRLDNGQIWGVAPAAKDSSITMVYRIDAETGAPLGGDANAKIISYVGIDNADWDDVVRPVQTIASSGNTLMFLVRAPGSDTYAPSCMDGATITTSTNMQFSPANAAVDFAHAPVRGAAYSKATGKLFILTAKRAGLDEGRVHEVDVTNCAAGVVITTRVMGLADIPSTKLQEGPDGKMYYGTSNGKLMRFDPVGNTVSVAFNPAVSPGTSAVHGFLSIGTGGTVLAVVHDYDADAKPSGRRVLIFDPAKGTATTLDASTWFKEEEWYPGVMPLK